MSFEELVAKIVSTTAEQQLQQVVNWLDDDEPFVRFSFNDGEIICMLGLRPESHKNNCGHNYFSDLGNQLKSIFFKANDPKYRRDNVHIASYWPWQAIGANVEYAGALPARKEILDVNASAFVNYLTGGSLLDKFNWVDADGLVKTLGQESMVKVIKSIRIQSRFRRVFLVGNPGIAEARHCLAAQFIQIPRYNCWTFTKQLMDVCRPLAEQESIFIWCCGLAKPWIWELWRDFPKTMHFDAGHIFDGVFGDYNRAWLRRNTEEPFLTYNSTFVPFVRSFIP